MKYTFYTFLFFVMLIRCNVKNNASKSELEYVVFYEVNVKFNPVTESISLSKGKEKLNDTEIKYLMRVLEELNWGYKVTKDNKVMIFKHYVSDIEKMYSLNNLWKAKTEENRTPVPVGTEAIKN